MLPRQRNLSYESWCDLFSESPRVPLTTHFLQTPGAKLTHQHSLLPWLLLQTEAQLFGALPAWRSRVLKEVQNAGRRLASPPGRPPGLPPAPWSVLPPCLPPPPPPGLRGARQPLARPGGECGTRRPDARGAAMRVQGGWKSPAVGRGLAGRGRGRRPEASRTQGRGPGSRRAASAGRGGQRGA